MMTLANEKWNDYFSLKRSSGRKQILTFISNIAFGMQHFYWKMFLTQYNMQFSSR